MNSSAKLNAILKNHNCELKKKKNLFWWIKIKFQYWQTKSYILKLKINKRKLKKNIARNKIGVLASLLTLSKHIFY